MVNSKHRLKSILTVSVLYFAIGISTNFVLEPFDKVIPIWPAAGFAFIGMVMLGKNAWPGVLIGSASVSLGTTDFTLSELNIVFALTAVSEALVAKWLTKRQMSTAIPQADEKEIIKAILLSGPIAALAGAVVWTAGSLLIGNDVSPLPIDEIFLNRWASDSLGVILFSPIFLLIWPGEHLRIIKKIGKAKIIVPLAVVATLLTAVNVGYFYYESKKASEYLHDSAHELIEIHIHRAFSKIGDVKNVERFILAAGELNSDSFSLYSQNILFDSAVIAIDWAVPVRDALGGGKINRDSGVVITDIKPIRSSLGSRDFGSIYLPVKYSATRLSLKNSYGLDHLSDPVRSEAIKRSLLQGGLSVSDVVKLERTNKNALLAFLPVSSIRSDSKMLRDISLEIDKIMGFVVGIYDINILLAEANKFASTNNLEFKIYDTSNEQNEKLIYENSENISGFNNKMSANYYGKTYEVIFKGVNNKLDRTTLVASMFIQLLSVVSAVFSVFALISSASRGAIAINDLALRARDLEEELMTREKIEKTLLEAEAKLVYEVEEKRLALNELYKKEQEVSAVIDNLLECIITIDAKGIIHSINPAVSKIFGYVRSELVGENVRKLMPECVAVQHDQYLNNYLCTGNAKIIGSSREVEGQHKDGSIIPLELSVVEFNVHNDKYFVGTLRDISERKRLINDLTVARENAELASKLKSSFLASMSHEIRTPMNGVIGIVDVLANTDLNEEQTGLIKTVRDSAATLLGIIDDILDFSKIESGNLVLDFNDFSIYELTDKVLSSLYPIADKSNTSIQAFIHPDVPDIVHTDELRLHQVLINILSNAIKFSSKKADISGVVKLKIFKSFDSENELTIQIEDNGIGIAADKLETIFEPFIQAENTTTRNYGGTGLGLAICKKIVEKLDGKIEVVSKPGFFTKFTVKIPVKFGEFVAAKKYLPLPIKALVVGEEIMDKEDIFSLLDYLQICYEWVSQFPNENKVNDICDVIILNNIMLNDSVFNVPVIQLQHGRRRNFRMLSREKIAIDCDLLKAASLNDAIFVVAGLESPSVYYKDNDFKSEIKRGDSQDLSFLANKNILVVEDDFINQKVICSQLLKLGLEADVANDGVDAIKMMADKRYDVVFTDLHMPKMDGYALARYIKDKKSDQSIKIVVITANALRGEEAKAIDAGADFYLTKPLRIEKLTEVLKDIFVDEVAVLSKSFTNSSKLELHNSAILDVKVLIELLGGDEDVMDFLNEYKISLIKSFGELVNAQAINDYKKIKSISHRLKSSSRSVGAMQMGELCAEIDREATGTDHSKISVEMQSLLDKLYLIYDKTIVAIDENLGRKIQ